MTALLVGIAVTVAGGAVAVFVGRSRVARVGGLTVMATGAAGTVAVVAASRGAGATLVAVTVATLAGLMGFAWWMERRGAQGSAGDLQLDRDPLRWS